MEDSRRPTLEIVIPFWNEAEVLPHLVETLAATFSTPNIERHGVSSVGYILVDDGSRDESAAIAADAIRAGLPATLCRLSRNFGHQSALSAGLELARADLVAVMDADLQDPPDLVLRMVDRWRQGHDVVYAQRRNRKEGLLKRVGYWVFYRLVAFLADLEIPLDSGDFCLMDRRVVEALRALPETLRFPRVLRAWVGFRQVGIEYERPERQAGRTKYSWRRLYRLATDGVASSSIRPLQLAQFFAASYLLLLLGGLALLVRPSLAGVSPIILGGFLLIVVGNFVQALCTYILGAYVGRTYLEVKRRPTYVVSELVRPPD